jgi:asparagine synthase (glutamine-hydrolysing)
MPESARLSGGMWSTEDSHFLGTSELVAARGARTVLTGCTADLFFKAYTMESRYRRLAGRNLPIKELETARVDAYPPNAPAGSVSGPLADAIAERLDERFGDTPRHYTEDSHRLVVEDRRVRPACYGCSVSGPIMYRIFPYDTFLADRAVVDAYDRLRAEWKVNARVWGLAVARVAGAHRDIGIANAGWRLDDSTFQKLVSFAKGWVGRRVNTADSVAGQGPATEGSWPNLGWYVENSETLRTLWESVTPAERERMAALWGTDPWAEPLSSWAPRAADLFRILTLLSHWRATPVLQP